jgi:transposase
MEKIVVGIDVSKDRLDVAIRPGGACFAVDRTAAGVDDLIAQLKGRDVKLIALEATGGFETVVAAALCAAGFPVVIVNPAQIRAFARALGIRAKLVPAQAGNRSDRCRGDCPFRRGNRAGAASVRR